MSKLIIDSRISQGLHSEFNARVDSSVFQRASRLVLRECAVSKPKLNMTKRNNHCRIRFEQFGTGPNRFEYTTDLILAEGQYDTSSLQRFQSAFSDALRNSLSDYVDYLDSQGQFATYHRQNVQSFSQYEVNLISATAVSYRDEVTVTLTNLNNTAIGIDPATPPLWTLVVSLLDDDNVTNNLSEITPSSFNPIKNGLLGFLGWYENRSIILFENSNAFTSSTLRSPFKPIRTLLIHSNEIRQAATEQLISNSSLSNKKISNSVIAVININDIDGEIISRHFNHGQYVFDVAGRGNLFSTNIDITVTDINGNIMDSNFNDITQLIFDMV